MASISTQATRLLAQHLIPQLHHANFVLGSLASQCTFSPSDPPSPYLVHSIMQTAMTHLCKYLVFAATFTSVFSASSDLQRIDTHIHALPLAYIKALETAGGDPSGYPRLDWTLDATIGSMDLMQTGVGKSEPAVVIDLNRYWGLTVVQGFFRSLPLVFLLPAQVRPREHWHGS